MKINYQKTFNKDLKKLSIKVKEQFYNKIEIFINDKYNIALNNHSVDPAYPECRSINVTGDYRAIFHDRDDTITFIRIGTHSQLY